MKHAVGPRYAPQQEFIWRGWSVSIVAFSDIYDVAAYNRGGVLVQFYVARDCPPALMAGEIMRRLRNYTTTQRLTIYRQIGKEPTDGQ